jgi:predicted Zn finger-like uncharacterized protein
VWRAPHRVRYRIGTRVKFICEQCKAKYQIADDKVAGKTVRMKCRKCGHQIEVRAAVTETSVSTGAPSPSLAAETPRGSTDAPRAPTAPRPAAPRANTLATSLASARPSPPRHSPSPASAHAERPGALAGAFKSNVAGKEEEISASFDLNELSAADEWYVAINGVPVGPIRVAEIRRKAALGAVNEESLCWQEGLEEWRPLKAFADLAAVVLEAATSGRNSLLTPQPPDVRTSAPPAPPAAPRPPPSRGPVAGPQRPVPAARPAAPAARNNVVPIASRLAVAEKLEDATVPLTDEIRESLVAADPFAPPPAAAKSPPAGVGDVGGAAIFGVGAVAAAVPQVVQPISIVPLAQSKKPFPWVIVAMLVLAAAFGITAALAIFLKPAPAPAPAPVVIQMPSGMPTALQAPTSAPSMATDPGGLPMASAAASMHAAGGPAIAIAGAHPSAAPSSSGPAFSLSGMGGARPTVDPTLGNGGGGDTHAPGQCLSAAQIQGVIGQHEFGVKRTCWDKSSTTRQAVSVGVTVSIGPGGEVTGVNANGDDNTVAACVSSNVHSWRFPAGGCAQQTYFKLNFVRQ